MSRPGTGMSEPLRGVGLTAVWVAMLRATESERADRLIDDRFARAFVDAVPSSFSMLAGTGTVFYSGLCLGAVGGILAVAAVEPELCLRLLTVVKEGNHEEGRRLQTLMSPLARMVTSGFGVPGLKAALDLVGYKGGDPRAPLAQATADAREQIRAELARIAEVV